MLKLMRGFTPCSSGPPATIGVHRLSAPPGGDRAGSALVPRYGLSHRDLEELLDERRVQVAQAMPCSYSGG
jgi:hypothetical protein